jgi:osmotically-inducible protein OsmY
MTTFASPMVERPTLDSAFDDDLVHRVRLFLETLHLPALRRVRVEVENGVVIIEGRVGSFHERQLALACVRRVAGVRQIVDNIRVVET